MLVRGASAAHVRLSTLMWRGRAPRVALFLIALLLTGLVASSLTSRPAPLPSTRPRLTLADPAVLGLAQLFAREYLSTDPENPERRSQRLSQFGLADDALASGEQTTKRRQVDWTVPVAVEARGPRARVVTVAAGVNERTVYLAVTVAGAPDNKLYVMASPALVGPPAVAVNEPTPVEQEVADGALHDMAVRVVRHYLARQGDDVAADLAAGTRVTLPAIALRLVDVAAVTWVRPATRVAVQVLASDPDGSQYSLRYELPVALSSGRWLARGVQVNPTNNRQESP